VRASWYFFALVIGALAGGGLFFALGSVLALYAFFGVGEQPFTWWVAGSTALGVVVGAWSAARVVRWLASEPPP
jgi:hypothetical protein